MQKAITNLWALTAPNMYQTLPALDSKPTESPSNSSWTDKASTIKRPRIALTVESTSPGIMWLWWCSPWWSWWWCLPKSALAVTSLSLVSWANDWRGVSPRLIDSVRNNADGLAALASRLKLTEWDKDQEKKKEIIPAQIDVHAFLNEVHHEKPDAHQQFRVVNFHVWGVV